MRARPTGGIGLAAASTLAMAAAPSHAGQAGPQARFSQFRYVGSQPAYAGLRPTPDRYLNPVIAGFHPDPSVVRVGGAFYLANSSMGWWPGVPLWRSTDLVHWKRIGAAVTRRTQMDLRGVDVSSGIYGVDLKHHGGRFYLLSTCVDCGGNFVMTARRAEGPWSRPTWLPFKGIDPAIAFDDVTGRAYVLNNGEPEGGSTYEGHRAIWLQEIDLRTLKMVGPRTQIVNGGTSLKDRSFWVEGPHLVRHDGAWWLLCAQGGTREDHSEVVFRADALRGPYVPVADEPILTQRGLDPARPDPVTSTGHADVVQTPRGDWWAVFLGTRPWAGDLYTTGRETFLLPMAWSKGGAPRILGAGAPVPLEPERPALPVSSTATPATAGNFAFSDDFAGTTLDRRWTWLRTPLGRWWRTGGGVLRMAPRPEALGAGGAPSLLVVPQSHMDAEVTAIVDFAPRRAGDRAGLAAFQDDRHFFALSLTRSPNGRRTVRLERRDGAAGSVSGDTVAEAPSPGGPVRLRIRAEAGAWRFAYAGAKGPWRGLGGAQDGAILTTAHAGGFTGAMLGPFAEAGGRSPRSGSRP